MKNYWLPTLISITLLGSGWFYFGTTPSNAGETPKSSAELRALTQPKTIPSRESEIRLREHPRIYLTNDSLPEIRKKLSSPVYQPDVAAIKSSRNPVDQAFRYIVFDDTESGKQAKQALIEWKIPRLGGMLDSIDLIQACVIFDWIYELLSDAERKAVAAKIMDLADRRAPKKKRDQISYYMNGSWTYGPAYETIAALTTSGDYARSNEILLSAYNSQRDYFSPYHGGALDVLNTIALGSGGGNQAGQSHGPGTGYESMFLIGSMLFLKAWESATGESMFSKTRYFERLPNYLTYSHLYTHAFGDVAKQTLEYTTGFNSEESASLAKWLLEREGRAKYALVFRLIFGDLTRVEAKSPEELNLPLVAYIEGADLVASRTSWQKDAVSVFMYARHWDTSRNEPDSGLVGIYRGSEPLLVRGIVGKSGHRTTNTSGIWIWPRNQAPYRSRGQGSTYWNELNNIPVKSRRAMSAADVLDQSRSYYRPETLKSFEVSDSTVSATIRYENLIAYPGIKKVERKVRHSGNNVEIDDNIAAPKSMAVLWSLRLTEEPSISGATAETSAIKISVDSPDVTLVWSGGVGKELIGPTGDWHGSRKGGFVEGYGKDPDKVRRYGLGYLFAYPKTVSETYEFRAKIQIVDP